MGMGLSAACLGCCFANYGRLDYYRGLGRDPCALTAQTVVRLPTIVTARVSEA